MSAQIELNTPVSDILAAKLKYHEEQMSWHKKQRDEIRKTIAAINGSGNGVDAKSQVAVSGTDVLSVVSQKTVKPLVFNIMKDGQSYTTNRLFEVLKEEHKISDSERKEWISAISSSLNSLASYGKADATETGMGRIKEYRLKESFISEESYKLAVKAFEAVNLDADEIDEPF